MEDFGELELADMSTAFGVEPATERESQRPAIRVRRLATKHEMRRITSEAALTKETDWHYEPGTSYHFMSFGDVDSLTFLRHILRQQPVEYALISTWCMAAADIAELGTYLDRGLLGKADFYVGEIFQASYANEWLDLHALMKRTGGRAAIFRNHSKVMAGFGERFDFVIESSANVNTNPRCENTVVTIDTGLALFYKEFFDGIKSFDRSFDDWTPTEISR